MAVVKILYRYRRQTWNLSKNLHCRIFRLNILHRQFHLISTVLVNKKHKKLVKMEKFTPLAKNLHCRRQWRHGQIPPLLIIHTIIIHISGSVVHSLTLVPEPERFIRHRCICTRPYRRATLKSRMLYNVLYNLGHDLNQFLS